MLLLTTLSAPCSVCMACTDIKRLEERLMGVPLPLIAWRLRAGHRWVKTPPEHWRAHGGSDASHRSARCALDSNVGFRPPQLPTPRERAAGARPCLDEGFRSTSRGHDR